MISWITVNVGSKNKYKHFESLCNSKLCILAKDVKRYVMVAELSVGLCPPVQNASFILACLFEQMC